MKNKKILKRMLAFVCATTILAGGFASFSTESKAATVAEQLKMDGYTKIGPENFGIMQEVVHEGTTDKRYRSSLNTFDMKYFEADLMLNMTTYNQSIFSYWEQYLFRFYVVNGNLTVFSSVLGTTVATASVTSGAYFNLKFATSVSENQSNNANSDITFTIWINDKSIATNTITVETSRITGDSAKSLWINLGKSTESVKIKPTAPTVPVDVPQELEDYIRVTPEKFGIKEETLFTSTQEKTGSTSYINKKAYFEADIALPYGGNNSTNIAFYNKYLLRLYCTETELTLHSTARVGITLCQVSMDTLGISHGEYFNLKVATDMTEDHSTTSNQYVKVQVWVNNKPVTMKNSKIYVSDAHAKGTNFFVNSASSTKTVKIKPAAPTSVIKYDDISAYRKNGNYAPTAPTGYIFAGWYSSPECGKANAISKDCKSGEAYAKFVDKHLLRIKSQITANTTADSPSTNIRFITSVDSFDYGKVGFSIMLNGKDYGGANNKVYQKLSAMEGNTTWDFTPKQVYSSSAIRFKAWVIRGVTQDYYDAPFTVTPFWETLDGTMVNGTTVTKTIREAIPQ